MKPTHRQLITRLSKYLMLALMATAIIIMAVLPFTLTQLMIFFKEPLIDQMLAFYYIFLYACGILAFLILNNLRSLFDSMIKDQPFVRSTEKRLMQIGIESFMISFLLIVKIFVRNSLMTVTSAAVFIIAGLFCFVLSDLFHRAVDYKEENDLTI